MYHEFPNSDEKSNVKLVYDMFDQFVFLEKVQRQDGTDRITEAFKELLIRLRNIDMSKAFEDYSFLRKYVQRFENTTFYVQ